MRVWNLESMYVFCHCFYADYNTIKGVNGPLVILDHVKVRFLRLVWLFLLV